MQGFRTKQRHKQKASGMDEVQLSTTQFERGTRTETAAIARKEQFKEYFSSLAAWDKARMLAMAEGLYYLSRYHYSAYGR